jgi:hypothetical protein
MKQIINLETGEVTDRELNQEELAQNKKDVAEQEAKKAAAEQAETDKAALLAKLGITADEAKLLLS